MFSLSFDFGYQETGPGLLRALSSLPVNTLSHSLFLGPSKIAEPVLCVCSCMYPAIQVHVCISTCVVIFV